jgi:hypothetical protein
MKNIVITGFSMNNFYSAGIFQTTLAYATAFKKLGHNVKIVVKDSDKISELKNSQNEPLIWLGNEYISTDELLKLESVDYLIYMGFIYDAIKDGGNGMYEALRSKFPDANFVYASFYNIPSALIAGITNETGFLSVKFENFNETFDELWVLESHIKGTRALLSNTFKCVKEMPLLVLEKDDYIEEYHNNKIDNVDIQSYEYSLENANKNAIINLDPQSRMKHSIVPIIGSLDWIRKEKGRRIIIGNAYPLWVNPDGNTNEEIFAYFKKYMSKTLTGEEYYNMIKQNENSPIHMYGRQPTQNILKQTKPFAASICIIGDWERWNVLFMDLLRFGVPVIHNFKDFDIGWKYEFPDTDGYNKALEQCQVDLFEKGLYHEYKKQARELFEKLSTISSNEDKLTELLK